MYGNHPHGFSKNLATSREAADKLVETGSAKRQVERILFKLALNAENGATCDELTQFLQGSGFPNIHNGTTGARLVEMEMGGQIVCTTMTRKTRANRPAAVYVHARFFDTGRGMQRATPRVRFATLKPTMQEILDLLDRGTAITLQPGGPMHKKLSDIFGG